MIYYDISWSRCIIYPKNSGYYIRSPAIPINPLHNLQLISNLTQPERSVKFWGCNAQWPPVYLCMTHQIKQVSPSLTSEQLETWLTWCVSTHRPAILPRQALQPCVPYGAPKQPFHTFNTTPGKVWRCLELINFKKPNHWESQPFPAQSIPEFRR